MFKVCTSYIRQGSGLFSRQLVRKFYGQKIAIKLDREFRNMKWNKNLEKKAKKLIFSEKNYSDFTSEEQKIVDFYQEKILEIDGGVILPNTKADLEQREIQQLIASRNEKNQ